MGTLKEIHPAGLSKLNNAEELSFLKSFRRLITPPADKPDSIDVDDPDLAIFDGNKDLGIKKSQMDILDAYLDSLTDLVNRSKISDETILLSEEGKMRSSIGTYITSMISQQRKSPIAETRNAALSLYNVIKPYVGFAIKADKQITQLIYGLIADLDKESNKLLLSKLNLTAAVEALKASNARFDELSEQRSANKLAVVSDNSRIVRSHLINLYDDMIAMAQSMSLIHPNESNKQFIDSINALIAETNASYNLRMGVAAAKSNKKPSDTPSDKPDPLEPDKPSDKPDSI